MSTDALSVRGLNKRYGDFCLEDVSFTVPGGTIVGLVGENGAGKTTVLRAVLGLTRPDAGAVTLLGQPGPAGQSQVGVVFDGSSFPEGYTPRQLGGLLETVHPQWDSDLYASLLARLDLPPDKKLARLSLGMKRKLSLAAALAHRPRLLLLDEATSGLDPVARDDVLDLLLEFVRDEDHSVLLSSHITSDLEKVADYIVFLHQGRVVFSKPADELRYQYGLLKCGAAQFSRLEAAEMLAWRKQDCQFQVLVPDRAAARRRYPDAVIDSASIEDILLLYVKGVRL